MPARNTSKAAFLNIQLTGIASNQRAKIFNFIRSHEGLTRREIFAGLNNTVDMGSVCARVNELLKSKSVYEEGCKHNPGTGKSANCLYVGAGA